MMTDETYPITCVVKPKLTLETNEALHGNAYFVTLDIGMDYNIHFSFCATIRTVEKTTDTFYERGSFLLFIHSVFINNVLEPKY